MTDLVATPEDIRHAYRLLLDREPDPTGFEAYCQMAEATRASPWDIASSISASREYKTRHEVPSALEEVEFNGIKLYPWRGDDLIGGNVLSSGRYEPHVLPLFIESVPVGGTVLDIGANIGIYTLLAAHKVGDSGRVFAVEPIARNVQSICAGVLGNCFHNVSIFPVAASRSADVVPILRNQHSSNGIVDVHASIVEADAFVPTQRIDTLLQGLDRLDVVKIDIEGHEPVAWAGIAPLVQKLHPVVFTEFNPQAIRNHSRVDPETYANALFVHTENVMAIHFDGQRVACSTVAEIMAEWREANRRAETNGTCHLDLVLRT